jgi:hypothetical protein
MKTVLNYCFFAGFFYLPLVLLLIRARWPHRMPWWKALVLVAVLGWVFLIGVTLSDDISTGEAAASAQITAVMVGWLQSLIWFVPWVIGYQCFSYCYNSIRRRGGESQDGIPQTH